MEHPTISQAAKLTRRWGARGVIVLVFDRTGYAAASYGATRPECRDLGALLDRIGEQLDRGEWPIWSEPTPHKEEK